MNSTSSDGNENVIDVFVLCKSETETPVKPEYLEQRGYHVTLFSDSSSLLETLHYGKPNLLVCDSVTLGPEAFDFCRQIKTDNDLWMIPVLILTRASSLSDLLFVLDSNADNFLAVPYDPPYLLSLIEGMLVTHVERQTPEQIKTQFKIQHDEHLFVVTADRRKLLEFLLSSFEIAVNKSDELARAGSAIASLKQTVTRADEVASEQGRVIGVMNQTLQQREQAISALNDEIREKARQIEEHIREKGFFIKEREEDKALIARTEDQVRAIMAENEELGRTHAEEAGEMSRKIAALKAELDSADADLATTRGVLDQESAKRKTAEASLEKLIPEKEQLEKTARALTLECGQLKAALASEKSRAEAAEQEARSLTLAKNESEQDLTRVIDELRATGRQQAGDIVTFREERAAALDRISALEGQLAALAAEKERSEAEHAREILCQREKITELESARESATATIAEKSRQVTALEQELADQKGATGVAEARAGGLDTELARMRSVLDDKCREAAGLSDDLKGARQEISAAKATIQSLEDTLGTARSAVEDKSRLIADLERVTNDLRESGAETLSRVRALETEAADLRASLDAEKQGHAQTRESLQGALLQRDVALSSLQGAHEEVKSHLDQHRDNLVLAKQELTVAEGERAALNARVAESLTHIRDLEAKLGAAAAEQAAADKHIRSLSDELEGARAALETERRQRRSGEESMRSAVSAQEKADEAIRQARSEQEKIRGMLDAEEQERRNAEERLRSLEVTSESRIQELSAELDAASTRLRMLEDQVRMATQGKLEAEEKAAQLEAEIDQARSALADEWEDHMTDNERYTAAGRKEPARADVPSPASAPAPFPANAAAAAPAPAGSVPAMEDPDMGAPLPVVIARTSALPVEIPDPVRSVVAVPPAQVPAVTVPHVTDVEDLFEDDAGAPSDEPAEEESGAQWDEAGDEADAPVVSIMRDEDPNVAELDPAACPAVAAPGISGIEEDDADELESPMAGSEAPLPVSGQDDGGEDDETMVSYASPSPAAAYRPFSAAPQGVLFDRTQWFDLLKWAHHSGALSQDQRLQIVRMGRLIQKGRRLTPRQDEQVRDMISLVQSLGYRFM
ncbi:MAG: hypothetical protein GYA23_11325 [Methanomicrobiales archaeon]|nr:hypothetical protein [Methanomicrobiales archaeon]